MAKWYYNFDGLEFTGFFYGVEGSAEFNEWNGGYSMPIGGPFDTLCVAKADVFARLATDRGIIKTNMAEVRAARAADYRK